MAHGIENQVCKFLYEHNKSAPTILHTVVVKNLYIYSIFLSGKDGNTRKLSLEVQNSGGGTEFVLGAVILMDHLNLTFPEPVIIPPGYSIVIVNELGDIDYTVAGFFGVTK